MHTKPVTATPCQIMVDQLAASGIEHVFYNPGSREALFFDALQQHPGINGVISLHEGSVASMAGGYAQTKAAPAIMVVHLGAGLAQALGQFINVWYGGLPVVVITFAGDTGSFADRINLDLNHSFGPTSIAAPMMKANWTVIEPEGIPQAIYRAIQVAKTPPMGPVHLAIYDRLLGHEQTTTEIINGAPADLLAGYPADKDIDAVAQALHNAERPLLYVGDGVWKSGAEATVTQLAESFGLPIAIDWGELRSVSLTHPQHCDQLDLAAAELKPDLILCLGIRHSGSGNRNDFDAVKDAKQVIAIGSHVENLKSLGGLDQAILADEGRTAQRLLDWLDAQKTTAAHYDNRRTWAENSATKLRERLTDAARSAPKESGRVRPWVLSDTLDRVLDAQGGGIIAIEQYAAPLNCIGNIRRDSRNTYLQAPGASEGWGIGATIGAKLAAPAKTVVGLVGDGSFCYADNGVWSAAHHNIPVLYVIPNNGAYGIVANSFLRAEGTMAQTGDYASVTLGGIDLLQVAAGFGLEGQRVIEESELEAALIHGLTVVNEKRQPYMLDVRLPLGLPSGGQTAEEYKFREKS